ncbi:hypothetical protein [Shewanella algae]|uniref:hypothetical protein n=1 Tax=Shewanella algae TaxID=38313 RepID=UPI001AAD08C4|nr:hypothetical protein [Shewanella algae]MBO2671652.1 hypothetical protein [Shewanella algae]
MTDDDYKSKATDYLTESLKTLVTISTIFIGGLIAFQANKEITSGLFYWSLAAFTISAFTSVLNINSIINKIYRSEKEAIQSSEAKILSACSLLCFIAGVVLSAIYISSDHSSANGNGGTKLKMDKQELVLDKEFFGIIQFDSDGKIIKIESKTANNGN